MEIFDKILHSYAMYCRKDMVKILKCYLIPKKSYGTLSKGAIFLANLYKSRTTLTVIQQKKLDQIASALRQRAKLNSKSIPY